ncbi:MAG: SPOR domain-containing protein [Bacteroidia bacterium]|nr:SPOR domain-containing protein [Bacteroidia bacterium]
MKRLFGFLICVCLWNITTYAQQGKVEIIGDEQLQFLVDEKVSSVDTTDLWGYRIQVYFGRNRDEATKVEQKFKMKYPDLREEVSKDYFQPNWRVRIGNFYRKIDAQKLMHKLEMEFGDVFLVRDKIELPVLD